MRQQRRIPFDDLVGMLHMLQTAPALDVAAHWGVSVAFLDGLEHVNPKAIRHTGLLYEYETDEPTIPLEVVEVYGIEYRGKALKLLLMDKAQRTQIEARSKERAKQKLAKVRPDAKPYGKPSSLGRTAPLSHSEVVQIKKLLSEQVSGRSIAQQFKVSPATIRRIKCGQSHRFIT